MPLSRRLNAPSGDPVSYSRRDRSWMPAASVCESAGVHGSAARKRAVPPESVAICSSTPRSSRGRSSSRSGRRAWMRRDTFSPRAPGRSTSMRQDPSRLATKAPWSTPVRSRSATSGTRSTAPSGATTRQSAGTADSPSGTTRRITTLEPTANRSLSTSSLARRDPRRSRPWETCRTNCVANRSCRLSSSDRSRHISPLPMKKTLPEP